MEITLPGKRDGEAEQPEKKPDLRGWEPAGADDFDEYMEMLGEIRVG